MIWTALLYYNVDYIVMGKKAPYSSDTLTTFWIEMGISENCSTLVVVACSYSGHEHTKIDILLICVFLLEWNESIMR